MKKALATKPKHSTFARGVHPPDRKQLARDQEIEVLPTPATVKVPVLQHIGAPSEALVKPRMDVTVGDPIAEISGFVSARSHASINGKVAKGAMATLPNGRHVFSIAIKASEEQPDPEEIKRAFLYPDCPLEGLEAYSAEVVSEAVKNAGIVGLGGAAFPTHVKITPGKDRNIDTVLVNGAECEPYLTADYRLMLEAPRPIIAGAVLTARASSATRIIIAIENNKPRAIETLCENAQGTSIEVVSLKTKYPQGSEKQLIHAVLGRDVPPGGLPLDVGVVVVNVGTAAAIARAVLKEMPLTHRLVTVTGAGIRQPKNLIAPMGTSYKELIEHCGGITADAARVVAGGPMMGFTLGELDVPVTKGTSGITILTHADVRRAEETTCVRCGRCVDVCPMALVPTRIAMAARHTAVEIMKRYHATVCVECGCCAYECPANIPLVQLIRMGKAHLAQQS